MGCERVSSAAVDGGVGLWWRPCCGAVCLSLLCLAWAGLGCVVGCAGSWCRSVREGRAGGGGSLPVGSGGDGLVVCPGGGGRWQGLVSGCGGGGSCRRGPAGGVRRWGLVVRAGVRGVGVIVSAQAGRSRPVRSPRHAGCWRVCLCVCVPGWGLAGWVVAGVGGPGWPGVGRGGEGLGRGADS